MTRSPFLFGGAKADAVRGHLNRTSRTVGLGERESPAEVDKAIKHLSEHAKSLKQTVGEFGKGLPESAARNEAIARKIAAAMPTVGQYGVFISNVRALQLLKLCSHRKVNNAFIVAASDVVSNGPDNGRDEKLFVQLDNVALLVETGNWLLPGPDCTADLEQMQKQVRQLVPLLLRKRVGHLKIMTDYRWLTAPSRKDPGGAPGRFYEARRHHAHRRTDKPGSLGRSLQ